MIFFISFLIVLLAGGALLSYKVGGWIIKEVQESTSGARPRFIWFVGISEIILIGIFQFGMLLLGLIFTGNIQIEGMGEIIALGLKILPFYLLLNFVFLRRGVYIQRRKK